VQLQSDIGKPAWIELTNKARQAFDPGTSLAKNPLFIAETLRLVWEEGHKPASLMELTERLVGFATS
jgi:hypothetical protein